MQQIASAFFVDRVDGEEEVTQMRSKYRMLNENQMQLKAQLDMLTKRRVVKCGTEEPTARKRKVTFDERVQYLDEFYKRRRM